jgi:hypothetical protein
MTTRAVHLKAKLLMMRWAVGAADVTHLVERLFYDMSESKQATRVHRYDAWERKDVHTSNDQEIFSRFTAYCEGDVGTLTLMVCDPWKFLNFLPDNVITDFLAGSANTDTIAEIRSFMPAEIRAVADPRPPELQPPPPIQEARTEHTASRPAPVNSLAFFVDLEAHEGDLHSTWIREGIVDQRFMYVSREAVDYWNAITESEEYQTYTHCEGALRKLVNGAYWQNMVDNDEIETIVILGAGAPSKDIIVLNSILRKRKRDHSRRLRLVVFDSSFYMLVDTITIIERLLKGTKRRELVEVIPCCADFMNLRAWAHHIRTSDSKGRVAFFILGGTIGNVEETRLFDSLKTVSREGDILVLSAEFGPVSSLEYQEQLRRVYDQDATRELALNAIRSLLDNDDFPRDLEKRLALVEVRVEQAEQLPGRLRSYIPGTIAVVFRTISEVGVGAGNSSRLVLVTSKRYDENSLIKALAEEDFILIPPKLESPSTDQYKNLIFEMRSAAAIRVDNSG